MRPVQVKFLSATALLMSFALLPSVVQAQIYCNAGSLTNPTPAACSGAWVIIDAESDWALLETFNLIRDRNTWDPDTAPSDDVTRNMYNRAAFEAAFAGVTAWDPATYKNYYWGKGEAGEGPGDPFEAFGEDMTSGSINLTRSFMGTFVLILKGGRDGAVLYIGQAIEPVNYISFEYPLGQYGLSHISLWADPYTVPEPSSLLLLGSGLLGMGFVGYRRRRK